MHIENKNEIPLEIERKFLPKDSNKDWRKDATSSEVLLQTYLNDEKGIPYRVRLHLEKIDYQSEKRDFNMHAVSCYKEFVDEIDGVPIYEEKELSLNFDKALEIINNNRDKLIIKRRSYIPFHEFTFEVDEYLNYNSVNLGYDMWPFEENLQTIEVEFKKIQDVKKFNEYIMPHWLGKEVTNDSRYKNSNLAKYEKDEQFSVLIDFFVNKKLMDESGIAVNNLIKPKF